MKWLSDILIQNPGLVFVLAIFIGITLTSPMMAGFTVPVFLQYGLLIGFTIDHVLNSFIYSADKVLPNPVIVRNARKLREDFGLQILRHVSALAVIIAIYSHYTANPFAAFFTIVASVLCLGHTNHFSLYEEEVGQIGDNVDD